MSADNYYIVRRHPDGGFVAVMGFASDVDDHGREVIPEIPTGHGDVFDTISEAVSWAVDQYSEYGVSVHEECDDEEGSETDSELPESVELGQLAFSNGRIHAHEADWAVGGMHLIAEAIAERRAPEATRDDLLDYNLATNSGGVPFENDVFAMRPYCWCDGEVPGHEDRCPPNFVHKATGLEVSWYKHAGRGVTANKERPPGWVGIVVECAASVI